MTRHHRRRGRGIIAATAAFALILAACGGDDDTPAAPAKTDAPAATDAPAGTDAPAATDAPAGTDAPAATDAPAGTDAPADVPDPDPAPGFDGTTFRVGVMTALSGPAALIGVELANGQQVYWDYVNAEKGGIAGKYPVEIALEDHLYDTATAVQKYAGMKDNVAIFSQVMGTPMVFALLPMLNEDGIIAAPASQDAFWVHEQYLLPVIEPYQIDAINAVAYYVTDGGGSVDDTICAVIQNDVYGEAGLQGVEWAADQLGFEVAQVARYAAGDSDFTAQITALKNAQCDMVWATALPTEFGGLTGTAAQMGFTPRWIAQSPAWVDELAMGPLKDYLEAYAWVSAVGREWGDTNSTAMMDLIDRVNKYRPEQDPDYYFSFGYMQAMATEQILNAAVANGDVSREGIVAAMNGLSELNFGDVTPPYIWGPPEDRNPPRATTVFAVDTTRPFSLRTIADLYVSPAAESYEIPKD